jgi:hypothetical protein
MEQEKTMELQILPELERKEELTSYLNLEVRKVGEEINLELYDKLLNLLREYKYELVTLRVSTSRW